MTLHEYLCICRSKDKDFREAHFAKRLGIHYTHLARIKNNQHRPGVDLAMQIEAITGGEVKAWELLQIPKKSRKVKDVQGTIECLDSECGQKAIT
jgi:plasmid maintenance system antidote protein VapI